MWWTRLISTVHDLSYWLSQKVWFSSESIHRSCFSSSSDPFTRQMKQINRTRGTVGYVLSPLRSFSWPSLLDLPFLNGFEWWNDLGIVFMRLYITSDISMLFLLFSSIRPFMRRAMTQFWDSYYLIVFSCVNNIFTCAQTQRRTFQIFIELKPNWSIQCARNQTGSSEESLFTALFFLFADLHWMSNTTEPASQTRTRWNNSVGQRRTTSQSTIHISSSSPSSL